MFKEFLFNKKLFKEKKAFIRFRGIGVIIIKVVSKSLANMLNKGIDAALEKNTVLMLHCIENYQPYQQRYQCDVEEEDL
jgi:tRNA G37 N-methylase Trm5